MSDLNPCGFFPTRGWTSNWARLGHRGVCGTCLDVESDAQMAKQRERDARG